MPRQNGKSLCTESSVTRRCHMIGLRLLFERCFNCVPNNVNFHILVAVSFCWSLIRPDITGVYSILYWLTFETFSVETSVKNEFFSAFLFRVIDLSNPLSNSGARWVWKISFSVALYFINAISIQVSSGWLKMAV